MSSGGWHAITDQQVRSASRVENTPGPPSTSDSRHVLGAQSPSAPRPRPVRRRLLRLHRPVPGSGSAHEERRAVSRLRIVVADDERPARAFLLSLLRGYDDVGTDDGLVAEPHALDDRGSECRAPRADEPAHDCSVA